MTTEIARGGKRTKNSDWGWRVSIAVVETNGPFSIFRGIERTMAIIEGNGMDLDSPDGGSFTLSLFKIAKFDGETVLKGRLRHGSVKNFNVMVDRNLFDAYLENKARGAGLPRGARGPRGGRGRPQRGPGGGGLRNGLTEK